jgi:hypothetical protein
MILFDDKLILFDDNKLILFDDKLILFDGNYMVEFKYDHICDHIYRHNAG